MDFRAEREKAMESSQHATTAEERLPLVGASAAVEELIGRIPAITYLEVVDDDADHGVRCTFVSEQIAETGYPASEWIADPELWVKTLHPDDRDGVITEAERCFRDKVLFEMEYRVVARDGRTIWWHDESMPAFDDNGAVESWHGITLDITARKEAEEARDLEASKAAEAAKRVLDILESVTDGFMALNVDWVCTYMNPRAKEILGGPGAGLIDMNLWDAFPEAADSSFGQALRKSMGERATVVMEDRYEPWDRWFEAHIHPSLDGGLAIYFQETTDRKRAEETRATIESRYRELFENAGEGIIRSTASGRILEANPAVARRMGYGSPEQLIAEVPDISAVYANPADRERVLRELEERGSVAGIELELLRRNGASYWVSLSARRLPGRPGEETVIEGMVSDITERVLAERELRASRERLRAIVDSEPECVMVLSPDGTPLEMNPAGLAMIEAVDLKQVVGRSLLELIAPEHREAFNALTKRVVRGESGSLEFEIVGLKGSRRWLETHAVPLGSGAERMVLGLTRDITERKLAREALRRSADLLQVAQQRAHLGSWELTVGDEVGVWSEEMFHLHGLDPSAGARDLEGFLALVHPHDRQSISDLWAHVMEEGRSATVEYRTDPARGPMRVLFGSVDPVRDASGEIARFTGTVLDITDRKRAQEELERIADQRRALLEALVTAQEDERAHIARELHDGMGQVLASLSLFASDLEQDEMSDEHRARLGAFRERIQSAVRDMRRLVTTLRPVELDDLGLVAALERLMAEVAELPGVRVDIVDDLDGVRVPSPADVTAYRVVQEALTNALRHGRATTLAVTLTRRDHRLVVVIEDDGRGFDPSDRVEGYGILGMRERANLAGGDLTIDSEPGRTAVRLEVPFDP